MFIGVDEWKQADRFALKTRLFREYIWISLKEEGICRASVPISFKRVYTNISRRINVKRMRMREGAEQSAIIIFKNRIVRTAQKIHCIRRETKLFACKARAW